MGQVVRTVHKIFIGFYWSFLCLIFVFPPLALAGNTVKMAGGNGVWPDFVKLDVADLPPFSETIETIDPNFKEDGIISYTGVRISKMLELAGLPSDMGLTIIGSDQYVGFLPKEFLNQGLVAWEMNGAPIKSLKGGPLKIIFPDGVNIHGSCYTWYVDAMVAGPVTQARLSVQIQDKETSYKFSDLIGQAQKMDPRMLSIAQGCRNEFPVQQLGKAIQAVPLDYFIPEDRASSIESVTLVPLTGPRVTLKSSLTNYPISIIVSCDNLPLHPALGGPFSVIFPVEEYPELTGLVPESGALFFLKQIIVDLAVD